VQAIAFAPDGTIFTANYRTGHVGHYSGGGAALPSWSLPRGPRGSLFWPIGIDTDARGDVYVSDFGNLCVYKCTSEGAVLDTLGWGTLVAPRGVTCNRQDGHVYVCDGQGYAIREFDESGELLRSIAADWYVSDVALGDNGELYASAYNGRVHRFAADGSFLATWQPADAAPNTCFPSLARGADGRMHVVDRAATRVLVLDGDLQKIGEWSLDCADLNLRCLLNGHSYNSETLTGLDIGGEGQAVLSTDCLPNQVAVFPSVPVPAHSTTWGRLKTLYR
jgi:DNA-binding beta-propeller fold protein YncE